MADFDDNVNKYCDKTLTELKEILRLRKLKVAGKKKDLVERLLFDDRNSKKNEPSPEFHMQLPGNDQYLDLHADHLQNFPNITKQRIEDFLSLSDKKLDEKTDHLYEQRYLRYVRTAKKDMVTFIASNVWAEMKKTTSYKVDISVDRNAVIQESQCECAVGQGPSAHCKHVGTVLLGLVKYCEAGTILTEISCTQVLQKFHKSKPQKGSPLKTRHLGELRANLKATIYDPRPAHRRNPLKTEETLRNMVLNWQGKSGKWPVLQKYGPANIKALASDHDYMKLTMEDHFLKNEKISSISTKEAIDLEDETRHQSLSDKWIQERTKRLTSSNFGTICKATEKRDISSLVRSLLQPTKLKSKPIVYGRQYESVAVEQFETLTKTKTEYCGLFVSKTHPMLAASPDRVINNDILVEVKCPYSARDQIITEQTVPYLCNLDGKLSLKRGHDYFYQVQGQLYCAGRRQCKFVVFSLKDMKVIDIFYDDEFVEEMVKKLLTFYELHFRNAVLQKYFFCH